MSEHDVARDEFAKLFKNTSTILEKSYQVIQEFMQRQSPQALAVNWQELGNYLSLYQKYFEKIMQDPSKLIDMQMEYWAEISKLWQNTTLAFMGNPVEPVIKPGAQDRRFNDKDWDQLPFFAFIKQAYLLNSDTLQKAVGQIDETDSKTQQQISFYTRQFINALSPTNFITTNPQVLKATVESQGENLIKGLKNMLKDIENQHGSLPRISMTDMNAFEVGKNIATTAGKIVYQNKLIQLIQYQATTKQVYQKPVLIVPPWINKYYILDLQPQNSLAKFIVDEGHTVYMISWANPDASFADLDFTGYMQQGILSAIDAITELTGEKSVNAIGYCLGGTLLAGTTAYLSEKKKNIINSVTYLATMLDFSEPGELGIFIDEPQVCAIEAKMKEQGYLSGSSMSTTFNLLRSNELIWSYFIQNYLLGKEPFPFDLLYWNCDNTNLPAAMHKFYLREMYMQNNLIKPDGIELANTPIDLRKSKIPAYFLSSSEDHIAPWRSTYLGALVHGGKVTFTLSGSGHIAGVVNPPAKKKYAHWTNEKLAATADEWYQGTKEHEGSWWPHWSAWIKPQAGEKIPARVIEARGKKVLDDAPGSYVKVKCDH